MLLLHLLTSPWTRINSISDVCINGCKLCQHWFMIIIFFLNAIKIIKPLIINGISETFILITDDDSNESDYRSGTLLITICLSSKLWIHLNWEILIYCSFKNGNDKCCLNIGHMKEYKQIIKFCYFWGEW